MSAAVYAHENGDCWPSQCAICITEDAAHEAQCQPCAEGSRCDTCGDRLCDLNGPEPRACGTTCADCPCSCTACLDARADRVAETLRHIERERNLS